MDRADGICERCKEIPASHVHHKHYRTAGNEGMEDLEALCLRCHGKEHPKATFLSYPMQVAIAKARRRRNRKEKRYGGMSEREARAILSRREGKILSRRGP